MRSFLLILVLATSASANTDPKFAPFVTPAAPAFTDAERHAELTRRRAAVAARMQDNSVLIMLSAEPRIYTNDVDYVFRQENNLYYLTALKQKGATLVITKRGGVTAETLYLPKREPANETWNGRMYSATDATRISGIRTIVDSEKWTDFYQSIKARRAGVFLNLYMLRAMPENSNDLLGEREFGREHALAKGLTGYKFIDAGPIFNELRQIKSPYEIRMLQHAIDITIEAQERAWLAAGTAKMEYEVQAEVEYVFRKRNADFWGYPSIVGCGPNATTLHYEESQGPVRPGELILMDVGAEYEHYSADVTRTFPVNGKFTREQADIYQLVLDSQDAAARTAKPGATIFDVNNAVDQVLKAGLFKLGLTSERESEQFRIWYMHAFGHWLGMNVHDVSSTITFAPGMTFTNEPGIYIRADALDYLPDTPENRAFIAKIRPAFDKYKNIGVRVEDNMLVTKDGVEWMTKSLPRQLADVEAFLAANRSK